MSGSDAPGRREVAHRLFATEFDAADLEYADSDEERAPKYVITPTGARVNRLFVVGVLTELERVNEEVVRARVVDPTGAFVVYAGQYQPDALAFLERTDPPAFVAITGKANAFQPEDSDRVFTSIRPESVAEVDAETRDRWTVQAAAHTLDRIGEFARSFEIDGEDLEEALREAGIEPERASGIALARDHYGTTPAYLAALRENALDAARQVAGEADSVEAPGIAPDEGDGREVDFESLRTDAEAASTDVDVEDGLAAHEPEESEAEPATSAAEPPGAEIEAEAETTAPEAETTAPEPEAVEPDTTSASETGAEPGESEPGPSGSAVGRDVDAEASAEAEPEPTSEPTIEGATDDLGDFEPTGSEPSEDSEPEPASERDTEATSEPETVTDATDEEAFYELDEDERAEVEEEFGVDFSTGGEVEEPGEAGIDVPAADEVADLEAEGGTPTEAASDIPEDETEPDDGTEPSDVNVEDAAMETMRELADGDGADRAEVVSRVAEEHGVEPDAVEDAIESALMSGRCYEPQDGVLKPI